MIKIIPNQKRYRYLAILILSVVTGQIFGQQEPNFTMYYFNLNMINPAYTSIIKKSEITTTYRSQWTGVEDAPKTTVLSYVTPLNKRLGFGFNVMNDQIFILNQTNASFDFSYEVRLSKEYYVHFGLKSTLKFNDLSKTLAGAPDIDLLFGQDESTVTPTFGVGLYLDHKDYYISISAPDMLNRNRYRIDEESPKEGFNYMHIYVGGGYRMQMSRKSTFTPAIMSRFVAGTTPTFDLNGTFEFKNIMNIGANYRFKESASAFVLFHLNKKIKFGAAYDMNLDDIGRVNKTSSLEFLLRYRWDPVR